MVSKRGKTLDELKQEYNLDDVDKGILQHLFNFRDTTNAALGQLFGLTEGAIRARRKKAAFQKAWFEVFGSAIEHYAECERLAAIHLKKWIKSADPDVSLAAIKTLALFKGGRRSEEGDGFKPIKIYESSIKPDGTLIQQILELEMGEYEKRLKDQVIDVSANDLADEEKNAR